MTTVLQGLVANDTQWFGGHTDVRKAVGAGERRWAGQPPLLSPPSGRGRAGGRVYRIRKRGGTGADRHSTNAGVHRRRPPSRTGSSSTSCSRLKGSGLR